MPSRVPSSFARLDPSHLVTQPFARLEPDEELELDDEAEDTEEIDLDALVPAPDLPPPPLMFRRRPSVPPPVPVARGSSPSLKRR